MEKTIVIHTNEKDIEIPVKASIAALLTYRAEFNSDLIKDLNEASNKLHPDPFMDAMKRANVNPGQLSQEELAEAIMKNVDLTALNAQDNLPDGETQMKVLQIVWAMAKAADKTIEKFDQWCDHFDILPIRNLADRCSEIWAAANAVTVELKN